MNDLTDEFETEDLADDLDAEDQQEAEEQQDEEPPAPVKDWSDEEEADAKLFGWKSPDQWQGEKPEGYIDNPKDFLNRVQRSSVFRGMQQKLETQANDFQEQQRKLDAMHERGMQLQREQYEARLKSASERARAAAEVGDMEGYDAAETERAEILKSAPQQEAPRQERPSPPDEVAAYQASDDGAWLRDPVLGRAAFEVIETTPGAKAMSAMEQVQFARSRVEQLYPDKFPKPEAPQPKPQRQRVDGGGLARGGGSQVSAFSKLPSDAKAVFERQVREGIFEDTKKDREEYANEYNSL